MPADRSKRIKENKESLSARIRAKGIIMPACTPCRRRHKTCVVSSDSNKCSECVALGGRTQCDVFGPTPQEWATLERTEQGLADELREAEEAQQKLMNHLFEMQAKVLRIRKQREMFRARAAEMLRRGLRSLDDLEALEESERAAPLGSSPDAHPPLDDILLDPATADALTNFDPSAPFWADYDLGFGTASPWVSPDDSGGTQSRDPDS
jgi:hypothetical protein